MKRIYACVPDLCFTVVEFARFFGSKNGPYKHHRVWVARMILITVLTRVRKFLLQSKHLCYPPALPKILAPSEHSIIPGLSLKVQLANETQKV